MLKTIMFVVGPDNHAPVFFNQKESVFVYYDKENHIFHNVEKAYIITDRDYSVSREFRAQIKIIVSNFLKNRNLPLDISYDLSFYRNRAFLSPRVFSPTIYKKTACHYVNNAKTEVFIEPKVADEIIDCFKVIEQYVGFFNTIKVRGVKIGAETLARIIGPNNYIDLESFKDGKSVGRDNPRFWIGNSISVVLNEEKLFGIVRKFNSNNFEILMRDGNKKLISYDVDSIQIEDIPVESEKSNLSETISNNFKTSLENIRLHRAKIKLLKVDKPYLSGNNFIEAKCTHCPNCGTILREEQNNNYECVMCSQSAKLISQDGDVGLFILGDKPVKYTFCLEEAKCCGNCGLSGFGRNKAGFKQLVGKCEHTSQIVQPQNTCSAWIPIPPKEFHANMKRNSTNFNTIVEDSAKEEIHRGIENSEYKMEDYSIRSDKSKDISASYEMSYLEWKKKLIEMSQNIPISEF